MSVAGAIAQLQSIAGGLSGVKEAPTDPPESANEFPFAVSYPGAGRWHVESAGWSHGLFTLITEIHTSRQILPKDVAKMIGYGELFLSGLLANQTLGGNVDTISDVIVGFGSMSWGDIETIGWRFEMGEVKITIT